MPARELRQSRAANLLLVAGSLLLTLLLLLLLEGMLRLAGLGAEDKAHASRLKYQQIYLPILEPAERPDGTRILRSADIRLPYQSILAEKPANALRVFIFGGSATAGLGFSPNVTFARHLERMLEEAYPERRVEVVNLGIVALASQQVQVLVEAVIRNYDPDVAIVYSGNNEFLEIHAEKYAAKHATLLSALGDRLSRTNLYRLLNRAIHGAPRTPSLAEQDFSREELRMTEAALIRDIRMRPEEIQAIVERYEATMAAISAAARAGGTPLVLMTVASNWKWRGRQDLPADWLDTLVPGPAPERERYRQAISILTRELEGSPPAQQSDLLFRRAVAAEALGDFTAARADYRAAMNADPHLRRALDAQAEGVRRVAARHDVALVDVIEVLSGRAQHGIIGFDEFYDYVHFTPRGVVLVAAATLRTLIASGILPEPAAFDIDDYVRERLAWQAALDRDPLAVGDWLGFGFDKAAIHDRDLWKYDKLVKELDARITRHAGDVPTLVYRGNAHAFRIDGAAQAARDYRAALAATAADAADAAVIRGNLEALQAERLH
jgi:tetratricopeptide (TPR) repeat protein